MVSSIDGRVMVCVPKGEFLMGSTEDDPDSSVDERPQRTVYLDTFWIDQTEVTNASYRQCVEAGDCSAPDNRHYDDPAYSEHPVAGVQWDQAEAYCRWAGKSLCTEAQWEKAARGTDGRTYPWGEGIDCYRANYFGCMDGTTAVGSYSSGASPYGVYDMAGNVWEWVADWYFEYYYANSPQRNPQGPSSGEYRVVRGGSWFDYVKKLRAASRYTFDRDRRYHLIGFRCCSMTPQSCTGSDQ